MCRSTNQTINPSIHQSINPSSKQSINQIKQSSNQAIKRSRAGKNSLSDVPVAAPDACANTGVVSEDEPVAAPTAGALNFGVAFDIHRGKPSDSCKPTEYHINQSIHQSINPSINPSIHPSIHQSINPSINQSINQVATLHAWSLRWNGSTGCGEPQGGLYSGLHGSLVASGMDAHAMMGFEMPPKRVSRTVRFSVGANTGLSASLMGMNTRCEGERVTFGGHDESHHTSGGRSIRTQVQQTHHANLRQWPRRATRQAACATSPDL